MRGSRDTGIVARSERWNEREADEALSWALHVETPRPGVVSLRGLAAGHHVIRLVTDEGELVVEADLRAGDSRRLDVDLP